jgi:hypothetical protein
MQYVSLPATAADLEMAIENLDAIQLEEQVIETHGGNPVPLNGEFTLTFAGYTTGALRFDSSGATVKAELEKLHTVQTVEVTRVKMPGNNLYRWTVTFVTNLGNLPTMKPNFKGTLTGTDASCTVVESVQGILINDVSVTKQDLDSATQGSGSCAYLVEFIDPVGNIANLNVKDDQLDAGSKARVFGKKDGSSPLGGTFIVSMGSGSWVTTPSLDFDISALGMKAALEGIASIGEVDVMREDLGNGHRWTVTFMSNLGNLPMMKAEMIQQEIQVVQTSGGVPTPLGGSFTLTFGGHTTDRFEFVGFG